MISIFSTMPPSVSQPVMPRCSDPLSRESLDSEQSRAAYRQWHITALSPEHKIWNERIACLGMLKSNNCLYSATTQYWATKELCCLHTNTMNASTYLISPNTLTDPTSPFWDKRFSILVHLSFTDGSSLLTTFGMGATVLSKISEQKKGESIQLSLGSFSKVVPISSLVMNPIYCPSCLKEAPVKVGITLHGDFFPSNVQEIISHYACSSRSLAHIMPDKASQKKMDAYVASHMREEQQARLLMTLIQQTKGKVMCTERSDENAQQEILTQKNAHPNQISEWCGNQEKLDSENGGYIFCFSDGSILLARGPGRISLTKSNDNDNDNDYDKRPVTKMEVILGKETDQFSKEIPLKSGKLKNIYEICCTTCLGTIDISALRMFLKSASKNSKNPSEAVLIEAFAATVGLSLPFELISIVVDYLFTQKQRELLIGRNETLVQEI